MVDVLLASNSYQTFWSIQTLSKHHCYASTSWKEVNWKRDKAVLSKHALTPYVQNLFDESLWNPSKKEQRICSECHKRPLYKAIFPLSHARTMTALHTHVLVGFLFHVYFFLTVAQIQTIESVLAATDLIWLLPDCAFRRNESQEHTSVNKLSKIAMTTEAAFIDHICSCCHVHKQKGTEKDTWKNVHRLLHFPVL